MKKQKLSLASALLICFALATSIFNVDTYAADNYDPVITDGSAVYVKNENGSMIPDKYNTGVDPNIELTPHYPTEASFTINGLVFIGRAADGMDEIQLNLSRTPNIEDGAVFVIENIDFSSPTRLRFQDYNHFANQGKKVTIIFKNCKFSSFYAEVNSPLFNTEFYDCDFNHAGGTHMKFERCRFHSLNGDTMNPLSNVTVKNSYMYYDGENYTNRAVHIDGFQSYGFQNHPEIDVENLSFSNVRIEMPGIKTQDPTTGEWFVPLVNAPIMLQGEFSNNMHDITLENMHVNGGAYSIYLWCKRNTVCQTISKTTLNNIQVGYAHVYGIRYTETGGVDTTTTTLTNVDHVTSLYIGSAWKDSSGVHVSVTNEMLEERRLGCTSDVGTFVSIIPAQPAIPVNNNNHPASISDYPTANDMPFDLDYVVADARATEVSCYDVTDNPEDFTGPLLRTARFDPNINVASQNGQSQGGQSQGGQSQNGQTQNEQTQNNQNTQGGQDNQNTQGDGIQQASAQSDTTAATGEQANTNDTTDADDELPAELPAAGAGFAPFALGVGAITTLLGYMVLLLNRKSIFWPK